jgi:YHS domain-containing protein
MIKEAISIQFLIIEMQRIRFRYKMILVSFFEHKYVYFCSGQSKNKTMKKIIGLSLVMSALFITSCGNDQVGKNQEEKNNVADKSNTTPEQKTYPVSLVNNKKDPTCGMLVTAGISDTLHYGKYVLGFCAEGCKKEFLKNPKGNIAAAELKK